MKIFTILAISAFLVSSIFAIEAERAANTIILSDQGVKNLRIKVDEATERNFEEVFFAIGRIEALPHARSVISSRIAGRIAEVNAFAGDQVQRGDILVRVESRQPGNPPPVIPLAAKSTGMILNHHVSLGESVEPDREMLDIVDLSKVWAIAKVPESEAAQMKTGTKARVRVAAVDGGKIMEGTLLRFGTEADRSSNTIDAIFELSNPGFAIRPGMRAEFSIIINAREDVLSIPRRAVQGAPTNRVVFVKDFDLENAYIKTPLELGTKNDLYIEVISGLFPGDEVVTNGSYALSFAGGGGGPSLKEALDAAHGHEHAEDGSELKPEDKAQSTSGEQGTELSNKGGSNIPTLIWAVTATVLLLVSFQANVRRKKNSSIAQS